MEPKNNLKEIKIKMYAESRAKNSKCKVNLEYVIMYRVQIFKFANKKFWNELRKLINENDKDNEPVMFKGIFQFNCSCDKQTIHPIIPKRLVDCVHCFKVFFKSRYDYFKKKLMIDRRPKHIDEDHIKNIVKLLSDYLDLFCVIESKNFMILTNLIQHGDTFFYQKYMIKFQNRKLVNIEKGLKKIFHKNRNKIFFQTGHLRLEGKHNMWYGIRLRISPYNKISTAQVKILERQFQYHFRRIKVFFLKSVSFVFSMFLDETLTKVNE